MFTCESGSVRADKKLLHILPTLISPFVGLSLCISASYHSIKDHRNTRHCRDSSRNPLTLIIPPFTLATRVERYRQQEVHAIKESGHTQFHRQEFSQKNTHFRMPVIFQFVQQLSGTASFGVIKERSSPYKREFTPEMLLHGIASPFMETGPGQMTQTSSTNHFLLRGQYPSTDTACARKKQVPQINPKRPFHHYPLLASSTNERCPFQIPAPRQSASVCRRVHNQNEP